MRRSSIHLMCDKRLGVIVPVCYLSGTMCTTLTGSVFHSGLGAGNKGTPNPCMA